MFVFNDGVPRSGKSYDCMKEHILPALKKKRHVWARMNGMEDEDQERRQLIADYLKMPLGEINHLLHHVQTKDVLETFSARQDDETGVWTIADELKNALIVIDEVHEFYVKQRKALPPEQEQFFALLGQNGSDGVIMTQYVDRLHNAVYGRVEKKNGFQKLTAVGLKNKYVQTYYQTISPTKFKQIAATTKDYDPAIFPLYKGYADGVEVESMEPYSAGSTNVWKGMAVKGSLFAVATVLALFAFMRFFTDGGEGMVKESDKPKATVAQPVIYQPGSAEDPNLRRPLAAPAAKVKEVVDPYKDLTPEQRYVAELSDLGRVRVASRATIGETVKGQIQWVTPDGVVQESLWLTDLEELGFKVTAKSYGFLIQAAKHVIVATPWPLVMPVRETEAKLYNTSEAGGATTAIASGASESGGANVPPGSGIIPKATNASATFPENEAYGCETCGGGG